MDRITSAPWRRQAGALLVSALLLSWVAIANGYPLLFADSGTYLRIGRELYFPSDRPVTYGLAILPLARASLWAVVAAQGLAAAWLIMRVLAVLTGRPRATATVAVCAALAGASSLPWFTGQIMPDVLTGLGALAVVLLACGWAWLARWERIVLPVLIAGIVAAHLSHVIVLGAAGAAGLLVSRRGGAAALGGVAAGVAMLCALNLVGAGRLAPSLQSDAFLLARLFDARLAQPVLAEACGAARPPVLCAARVVVDRADDPMPGQSYLWAFGTPRVALAARDAAGLARAEQALVRRTIAERPAAVARMALAGAFGQLIHARTGDGLTAYGPRMQVSVQVAALGDGAAQAASRQQRGTLAGLGEAIHPCVALASALVLAELAMVAVRRRDRVLGGTIAIVAVVLLANAATCGILSGVFDRYQARVLWLLPFAALAGLLRLRVRHD